MIRSLQAGLTAGASGKTSDFFSTFSKVASRREPLQAFKQADARWRGGQNGVESLKRCQAAGLAEARPVLRSHTWRRCSSGIASAQNCAPEGRCAIEQLKDEDAEGPPIHLAGVPRPCGRQPGSVAMRGMHSQRGVQPGHSC